MSDDGQWTPNLVLRHLTALLHTADVRYRERFDAQEKATKDTLVAQKEVLAERIAASDMAVRKAEENSTRWRDNANEWRGAMSDREATFVQLREFALLKERLDKQEGAGKGIRDLWGWVVAAVMLVITIASRFFPK